MWYVIVLLLIALLLGFILGVFMVLIRDQRHSVKGTFSVEELEDAPGYGKIHINFDGTMLDKDTTDKIILHRDNSPE